MKLFKWINIFLLIVLFSDACAMGLRSFVALPIERGGMVFRFQGIFNVDNHNQNLFVTNFAYGLSGYQTLLLGFPYRFSADDHQTGDFSALYRHTVWQDDHPTGSNRLALLGGILIPTNSISDGGIQGGAVATFYKGRQELDIDGLWQQGIGDSPNRAQYDISYQYRLYPAVYPEADLSAEWDGVIEYNGRWIQNNDLIHQATVGLQWIHAHWILEGGMIQDINASHDTRFIVSTRYHV